MTGRYLVPKQLTFTQASPATTWTILHSFGGYPVVDVFVTDPETSMVTKILPAEVNHISNTTVQLTFTTAQSGSARLLG